MDRVEVPLLGRFLRDREALWEEYDRAIALRDSPSTHPAISDQFHEQAVQITAILKGTSA